MTITVKEAVLAAAQSLGIYEDVSQYVNGENNESGERYTALLLRCFRSVENELALDYLPLMAEEELVSATGEIAYQSLQQSAVKILCVEDEWGKSLKYKLFPEYVKTQAGKVKITYAYTPSEKDLEDVSDYQTGVSVRLFAYGIVAEYYLTTGETEAASAWDKKYKDAVRAAYRLRPCKKIQSRRWA